LKLSLVASYLHFNSYLSSIDEQVCGVCRSPHWDRFQKLSPLPAEQPSVCSGSDDDAKHEASVLLDYLDYTLDATPEPDASQAVDTDSSPVSNSVDMSVSFDFSSVDISNCISSDLFEVKRSSSQESCAVSTSSSDRSLKELEEQSDSGAVNSTVVVNLPNFTPLVLTGVSFF